MKEQNIKKNIKKNSTWGVKLIRNWPCDKISCERWENWMCKNALIIDSGEENKTKYSRIFILVLYWLKFDKTKEVKAKNSYVKIKLKARNQIISSPRIKIFYCSWREMKVVNQTYLGINRILTVLLVPIYFFSRLSCSNWIRLQ